jgi:hypothetical protein
MKESFIISQKGGGILEKDIEFIFPMNYKEKEKFLGFIDYRTLVVLGGIGVILFLILKSIKLGLIIKISIFISIILFFSIIILIGINGENMLDFMYFSIKFLIKPRVYVYRKFDEKGRSNLCKKRLSHGS